MSKAKESSAREGVLRGAAVVSVWKADEAKLDWGRPLRLYRPCPCGCDRRDDPTLVGYLSGSTDDRKGFTLSIYDETEYQALKAVLATVGVQEQTR